MKLGILVNTDRNLKHIIGAAKAAINKGHEVLIFSMDDGVRLMRNTAFTDLCNIKGISISFCDYSTKTLEVSKEALSEKIVCGSQYNNAALAHQSDRLIIL